mmetsp:Transcript_12829/g.42336  ORF Transcript_12829/g.42336 Transcript_12829/m.42336 type:complete len:266 (-) Transcript_12829:204-1001(-)
MPRVLWRVRPHLCGVDQRLELQRVLRRPLQRSARAPLRSPARGWRERADGGAHRGLVPRKASCEEGGHLGIAVPPRYGEGYQTRRKIQLTLPLGRGQGVEGSEATRRDAGDGHYRLRRSAGPRRPTAAGPHQGEKAEAQARRRGRRNGGRERRGRGGDGGRGRRKGDCGGLAGNGRGGWGRRRAHGGCGRGGRGAAGEARPRRRHVRGPARARPGRHHPRLWVGRRGRNAREGAKRARRPQRSPLLQMRAVMHAPVQRYLCSCAS